MATTATAHTGRGSISPPARSPELDAARALALVAAVVVVSTPGPLPRWLASDGLVGGLALADVLPAAFATIAGVAVAHQVGERRGASTTWWSVRLLRRVLVLLGAGLALQLLLLAPTPTEALSSLRLTGDLARIGVASALGMLLVRLPDRARSALAAALVTVHTGLVVGGPAHPGAGGALRDVDASLLDGWALAPVDPDGVTALAPTVALVLIGAAVGDWLRSRPRGANTVGVLLAASLTSVVAAWGLGRVFEPLPSVWSPPVLAAGVACTLALLALGQAGTRRAWSDRWVATLAVAGRVTLPLWLVAVVASRWFGGTPPVRWVADDALRPALGVAGANLVLGLLLAAGLVRLGGWLVDNGWHLRA